MTTHAFVEHNHEICRAEALKQAHDRASERGARLTPVREAALRILLSDHRAMGAYEVLDKLVEVGFARQPPVAYRALDFLVDLGLAHRIQSLNSFAACLHPSGAHAPAFLICKACRRVDEIDLATVGPVMQDLGAKSGFNVDSLAVEALGLCPACEVAP